MARTLEMFWNQSTLNSTAVEKFLESQFSKRPAASPTTSRRPRPPTNKTTNKGKRSTVVIRTTAAKATGRGKNRSAPRKTEPKKTQAKKGKTLLKKKKKKAQAKRTQSNKKKTQTKV